MLVCNVSLSRRRAAIAASVAETTAAVDATATGNVVFATLVDDPANVRDVVNAYLGEIMLEAASAAATVNAGLAYAAAVVEAVTAGDTPDAAIPNVYTVAVAEAVTASDTQSVVTSAEVSQFLARTSGLDATHTNAYTALIDGLVADGIWAKLDMLHIYATQNSTTANLNLIGNVYNATPTSSPTFTTDRGYTGASSGAKYVRTGFTPSTASSPKFTQNSGHVSIWSLTDAVSGSAFIMGSSGAGSDNIGMHARFTGNLSYFYLNGTNTTSVASPNSLGHFLSNRSTSSNVQGYKNGSSVVTSTSITSVAVNAREIFVAGQNQNGSAFGSNYQAAMASIGSSLSSTEVTNFYNRLRTYMTAVGVP